MDDYDPMNDVKNLREMLAAALDSLNTERQRAQAERRKRDRENMRDMMDAACRALEDTRKLYAQIYAGRQLSAASLLVFADAIAATRATQSTVISEFSDFEQKSIEEPEP
jgi:uncharacterized membrane protein